MPSQQQTQKNQLRHQLRRIRQSLSAYNVQQNSLTIIQKLINSDLWAQSQHIGVYLPINNEVDLRPLLNCPKKLYVPSIAGDKMQFHSHHSALQLSKTSFGLIQPAFKSQHKTPKLDVCLLPLLGFDNQGHRLGMGGGFYDRYFADNTDTILLGVAHAVQQLDELPIEPWDVTLQGIITEQQWLTI